MSATLPYFILSSVCALALLILPGLALLRICLPSRRLRWLSRVTAAPGITIAGTVLLFTWCRVFHVKVEPWVPWSMILISIGILLAGLRCARWRFQKDEWFAGITLFALLAFLLLVRFNSTRDWVVPPGFDSPSHTIIVQLLLDHHGLFDSWSPYDDSESFTYHFGFHAITALFAWMTGAPPHYAVLVMARVVGLCAVASLFPLVRLWTHSAWGGVVAVAVWELYSRHLYFFDLPGRWPLLTGLTVLPSALVFFHLWLRERSRKLWRLGLLATLTSAGLLLVQYKTAIIFVALTAAVVCARLLGTILSAAPHRLRCLMGILARAGGVALLAVILVAPRYVTVWQAKTGQQLQRIVLQAPPPNPAAFGAPQLGAGGILRTAFNTPQKVVGSLLALAGGILILIKRRQALWFVIGWFIVAFIMNPRLLGLNRAGLIDEIHWKFAVQTAVAILAGLAVGLIFDQWGNRRASLWNVFMMLGALLLAIFGAERAEPVPQSSRYVLPEDLRLMSWMKHQLPPGEKIAARSYFDRELVAGYDAAMWIAYFTQHRTNLFAASLEKTAAGSRETLRSFARELHERDMSDPESALWLRAQGFPWFYAGAIEPDRDAKLLDQIARNPAMEVVRSEGGARLYRVK